MPMGLGPEIKGDKSAHWTGTQNSARTFGHFGQSGSFLWVDPEAGLAAAFLGERRFGPDHVRIWPGITDAILERFAWGGHMGLTMLPAVVAHIDAAASTLVFTNTRSQCERWFQAVLEARPDWAGLIALHHGSLAAEQRRKVEAAMARGDLRAVVCTSTLDLGIDWSTFRTVDGALDEFDEWLGKHFDHLRANPGDDLFSTLLHATDDEGRLSERELKATAGLVLAAGLGRRHLLRRGGARHGGKQRAGRQQPQPAHQNRVEMVRSKFCSSS